MLFRSRVTAGFALNQPDMQNTILPSNIEQSMLFKRTDQRGSNILIADDLVGIPKRMNGILQERGLWEEGLKRQCGSAKKEERETEEHCQARLETDRCKKRIGCCALRLLENEPDFLSEKSLLGVESPGV